MYTSSLKKRKADSIVSDRTSMPRKMSVQELPVSPTPMRSQELLPSSSQRHGTSQQPSTQSDRASLQNCPLHLPVSDACQRKPQVYLSSMLPLHQQQPPSTENQSESPPSKSRQAKTCLLSLQGPNSMSPLKAFACSQSQPLHSQGLPLPSETSGPTPLVPDALVALPADLPERTCPSPHTSGMVNSVREQSRRITEDIKAIEERCQYFYADLPRTCAKPAVPVQFAYLGEGTSETSLIVAMIEAVLKKMSRVTRSVVQLKEHICHWDNSGATMIDEILAEYKKNAKGMKMMQECIVGARKAIDEFSEFWSDKDSEDS
ncbi:uncharacterized protein LOC110986513 isoform X2 [Acanthaster planci]|uniref:Uncharacterized protein LOC110986513 isoform X2 n=1 Tax=Acanthaster planci TaxID=133434 RepID=A0A8B7ZGX4_ACAPL|nr:uncharacterized protein LOC110986513 isoform X2 [Acanthaster planci]